ncbi:MAG: hypothetical protein MJ060_03755 [Clostridia bacterium]|nr:hypothetical protein [Clostridia bacterium]
MKILMGNKQDEVMMQVLGLQELINKVDDTALFVDLTNSLADLSSKILDIEHLKTVEVILAGGGLK